jgi:hypothetical protein
MFFSAFSVGYEPEERYLITTTTYLQTTTWNFVIYSLTIQARPEVLLADMHVLEILIVYTWAKSQRSYLQVCNLYLGTGAKLTRNGKKPDLLLARAATNSFMEIGRISDCGSSSPFRKTRASNLPVEICDPFRPALEQVTHCFKFGSSMNRASNSWLKRL